MNPFFSQILSDFYKYKQFFFILFTLSHWHVHTAFFHVTSSIGPIYCFTYLVHDYLKINEEQPKLKPCILYGGGAEYFPTVVPMGPKIVWVRRYIRDVPKGTYVCTIHVSCTCVSKKKTRMCSWEHLLSNALSNAFNERV